MNNKKTLNVAVIGTGYFSHFHYSAWQRMTDVNVIALHSFDEQQAKLFSDKYHISHTFSSVQTMLTTATIDLVDIVAPPNAHKSILEQCIKLGIPAICQKPFCDSVEQATQMVALIEHRNALVAVHENIRFQPWYQHIHQLLNENLLGQVYEFNFKLRPGDGQGPNAYLDRQPYFQQQARFLIQETGVHWIDVFRFLGGEITGLFAKLQQLNPAIAGEDAGIVYFSLDNGARAILNGNRLVDHAANNCRLTLGELNIEGEKGCLALNGDGEIYFREHGKKQPVKQHFEWNDNDFGGDCVYTTNRHIVNHILYGQALHNSAKDYLQNRLIEQAIYDSNKSKCWINIE